MPLSKETLIFVSANPSLSREVGQRAALEGKQPVLCESLDDALNAARNSLTSEITLGVDETPQVVRAFVLDARLVTEGEIEKAASALKAYFAATEDRVRVAVIPKDIKVSALFSKFGITPIETKDETKLAQSVVDYAFRQVGRKRGSDSAGRGS